MYNLYTVGTQLLDNRLRQQNLESEKIMDLSRCDTSSSVFILLSDPNKFAANIRINSITGRNSEQQYVSQVISFTHKCAS